MSKRDLVMKASKYAADCVVLKEIGLRMPSFWDWFLPWRAYRWQKTAVEAIVELRCRAFREITEKKSRETNRND